MTCGIVLILFIMVIYLTYLRKKRMDKEQQLKIEATLASNERDETSVEEAVNESDQPT